MNLRRGLQGGVAVLVLTMGAQAFALAPGVAHAGWLVPEIGERVKSQVPPMPPQQTAYDFMTREQLLLEKQRLNDEMPGLAGPVILISAGAGGLLLGTYYIIGGAVPSLGLGIAAGAAIVVGVIFAVGGLACGIAGIFWLISRLNDRAPIRDRIEQIEKRLDTMYFAPPGMQRQPEPPVDVPPPPPPPPPSAQGLEVPAPSMVLAFF